MFSFIIITNSATEEIDKTLKILLKNKTINDRIMVINYNHQSIKYRSDKRIEYFQVTQSRQIAINVLLPKHGNVVLLQHDIIISDSFVQDLYKHYDHRSLCCFRIDSISGDKKYIESDYRIGSIITPENISHYAFAFNIELMNKVGETPKGTGVIASEWGIPLKLLPNVKTFIISQRKKQKRDVGITIFIQSTNYKYINQINDVLRSNDVLHQFNGSERTISSYISKHVSLSPNDCILIINPESKIVAVDMLGRIRNLFDNKKCILFDVGETLTENAWLVVPKSRYPFSQKKWIDLLSLQKMIISQNKDNIIKYHEKLKKKSDRVNVTESTTKTTKTSYNDRISIIIPFAYNGDRWSLFEASINRLYNLTKDIDSIEIIVHEASESRFIKPDFIESYDLVYLYSEYKGLFNRAWILNVAARYIAKGDALVFFDADLIVDEKWIKELLECDKSIPYIGWGEMINLDKKGTDIYLKSKKITKNIDRIRKPSAISAAAGINVIPREIFFNIGGIPESYKGFGYGGEDNSLSFKMISLGIYDKSMKNWK